MRAAPLRPVGSAGGRQSNAGNLTDSTNNRQDEDCGFDPHDRQLTRVPWYRVRHMRKIDIFTHITPGPYYDGVMKVAPTYKDIGKRMRGVPMLADLDVRFRVMDQFGDYVQVFSLPTPPIEVFANKSDAVDLARATNDGMADLVRR